MGSSRKSKSGSLTSATPRQPLLLAAGQLADPAPPLRLESDHLERARHGGPCRVVTSCRAAGISSTVSYCSSGVSCSWMPSRCRSAPSSDPSAKPRTSTCPSSGRSSPSRISTVVVLPAPFGPSSPKHFAAVDPKIDPADRLDVAVAHNQPSGLDDRLATGAVVDRTAHGDRRGRAWVHGASVPLAGAASQLGQAGPSTKRTAMRCHAIQPAQAVEDCGRGGSDGVKRRGTLAPRCPRRTPESGQSDSCFRCSGC